MNRQHFLHTCRTHFMTLVQAGFPILHSGQTLRVEWHHEAICCALQRVIDGEEKRLIISLPPRMLKSMIASVFLPAFILGLHPSAQIMVVCYSAPLAHHHSRARRRFIQSELYRSLFPGTQLDRITDDLITTDEGGACLSTTIGGTVTGFGADYIVIDDPMSATDAQSEAIREGVRQFYAGTLSSRLNNPANGAIILVMQRLHQSDLAGHLLKSGKWRNLKLQAIATEHQVVDLGGGRTHTVRSGDLLSPERLSQTFLDHQTAEMGSYAFAAQYQQDPVPAGGKMVKSAWFRYFDMAPPRESGEIILSLDTATKTNPGNDYSVCTIWLRRDPDHYLIDLWREKVDYPTLRKKLIDLRCEYNASRVLIEDHGSGAVLAQELGGHDVNVVPRKATVSKESRLSTASALIEAGHVVLPSHAPWLATYMSELLAFPGGHDDQVDSTSQYLNWAREQSQGIFNVDWMRDDPLDHGAIGEDFRAVRFW